jgi:hypothetical protein
VNEYKGLSKSLFALRVIAPAAGIVLGVVCLLLAAALWARRGRREDSASVQPTRRRETVNA